MGTGVRGDSLKFPPHWTPSLKGALTEVSAIMGK